MDKKLTVDSLQKYKIYVIIDILKASKIAILFNTVFWGFISTIRNLDEEELKRKEIKQMKMVLYQL